MQENTRFAPLQEAEAEVDPARVDPNATLRPALIVGLGGTGQRIAVHVKAAFTRADGGIPQDRLRILAFDTADESIAVAVNSTAQGDGHLVALEPDRELFNIGHTPVANILRNLAHQPAIAARLPGLNALPPVTLRAGAKQVRPLGLLSLLWHFDEVERRLKTAIWELAGKETLGKKSGAAQGINVFICFSVVGGTGSGTFLDIAYLVRSLFREMGTLGDFCYITGVAVLPQAFQGIGGPNIIPNTVAAFKELGHCMLRGGFAGDARIAQYPNGRCIDSQDPPFNLLYLLDGVDEQGYVWRGLNELCAMAATGIYLQVGSQVGRKGENDFDNLDDVLGGQTDDGEGTFCGSFGMAMLRFDGVRAADWCAHRLAGRLVAEGLLGTASDQDAQTSAAAWLRAHALSPDGLHETLSRDETGVPLSVDVRPPDWIARSQDARVPQEASRYMRDYQRVRLKGEYHTQVQANRRALETRLPRALDDLMATTLSTPSHGVSAALALCHALDTQLDATGRTLAGVAQTAGADRARLEEDLAAREETLLRAANAGFLTRGRAIAGARDRYIQVAGACFERAWQEILAQAALSLLGTLRRAAGEWQNALGMLKANLQVSARAIGECAEALLGQDEGSQSTAVIDLADPAYCHRLYAVHEPPLEHVLAQLSEQGAPTSWLSLSADEITERLLAAARAPFAPLAALSVEQVIRERASEASPSARKERLTRLATPSWNLDLTRLRDGGAGLRSIQVLGVPDEGDSIFKEEARLLVSTYDPTAVVAFTATIGAPFSALQQYPAYLRYYEAARRARPLHILPQFQADGQTSKLAFALATIFDLVSARGTYFYYHPLDSLDPPIKLDQGLEKAIARFARYDSLPQEAMDRVERQIEAIGTAAAVDKLAGYYEQSAASDSGGSDRSGSDPLLTEMRKLVRTFADELRTTQRAAGNG